ncbi:unnamed protein product, partial [Urochloa humidicola]
SYPLTSLTSSPPSSSSAHIPASQQPAEFSNDSRVAPRCSSTKLHESCAAVNLGEGATWARGPFVRSGGGARRAHAAAACQAERSDDCGSNAGERCCSKYRRRMLRRADASAGLPKVIPKCASSELSSRSSGVLRAE